MHLRFSNACCPPPRFSTANSPPPASSSRERAADSYQGGFQVRRILGHLKIASVVLMDSMGYGCHMGRERKVVEYGKRGRERGRDWSYESDRAILRRFEKIHERRSPGRCCLGCIHPGESDFQSPGQLDRRDWGDLE